MKKRDLVYVFLIVFLPRFFLSLQALPLVYASDETSAFSVAAFLSGYDWGDVVSHAGYYGVGYLCLLAPLFHLIDDPIWIYRAALIILSVTVSLCAPICNIIMYRFFSVESRIYRIIVSGLCGTLNILTVVQMTVRNEEILYLLIWLTTYLLCCILQEGDLKRHSVKKEVLLLLLLGYSLTVHTRSIGLIIGVICADIICRIMIKQELLHKWSYLIILAGYKVISSGLKIYQSGIWGSGTKNTSVVDNVKSSLFGISDFTDINLYLNVLRTSLGQIYTAGVVTGGLFVLAIFILLFFFLQKGYKEDRRGKYIFALSALFLFCTIITIGGLTVSWLSWITNDMRKYEVGVYRSAYRAFSYLRYMGCYVSPFIMCALIIVEKNTRILKRAMSFGVAVMSLLTVFWIKFILPYVVNGRSTYYMTLGNMKANEEITNQNWFLAFVLVLLILIIGFLLIHLKKECIYFGFIIILLTIERIFVYNQATIISGQFNYSKADAGYELMNEILDEKQVQEIYVYDGSDDTDHQIFYLYQFLNYSIRVKVGLPEIINDEILLFSNKDITELLDGAWFWAKLDNNEYVYCTSEEMGGFVENYGIKMQKLHE